MHIKALVANLVLAAILTVSGGSAASAQTKNTSTHKPQVKLAQKVQSKTVIVVEGDNLSNIATDNSTTYQRLYDANTDISDPDLIYPDQAIRIPDPSEQIAHRDLPAKAVPAADAQAETLRAQTTPPKAVTAPVVAAPSVVAPVAQPTPTSGCGDNSYANYIYMHESRCNTGAQSSNGCFGIGQACPASKLAYCGTDYACQNEYFTSYAGKYGGWEGAYNFWVSHGWW
jgi:LysM repeat protein